MKIIGLTLFLLVIWIGLPAQVKVAVSDTPVPFKNYWTSAPQRTPSDLSVDAPLMGNGDLTMSIGFNDDRLRYYLSKNDFWRLRSQADRLSGPRVVGFVDLKIEGFNKADFSAVQLIKNGITTCQLKKGDQRIESRSWVSATGNLIFIEVNSSFKGAKITLNLIAPQNRQAILKTGKLNDIFWLTRTFADSVDIPTEVAVALKIFNSKGESIIVEPGKKLLIAMAVESKFKKEDPLGYVQEQLKTLNSNSEATLLIDHNKWWQNYWNRSSVAIDDTVLMKAWYQGLYTMASCSRNPKFPPGLFGWTTNDTPAWNGDYHLNYNFQAPFYCLCSANRLEQAEPHDQPLLDFLPRGEFYGKNATKTREYYIRLG